MLLKTTAIAGAVILLIGILGCGATTPTQLDKNWGRSFETAKTTQTLNPDAKSNLEPVEGIEGPVAEKILDDHVQGGSGKKEKSSGYGVLTIQQ